MVLWFGLVFFLFLTVLLSLFFPGLVLSSSGAITQEMEGEAGVFPRKEQILEYPIFARVAAPPAPKPRWRDVSKAWPQHSPAGRDRGRGAWKKHSGSKISWTLP